MVVGLCTEVLRDVNDDEGPAEWNGSFLSAG